MSSEDSAAGGLVGHPVVARMFDAGRRLRQWDAGHPWALDTLVVLVIFLVFCLPGLLHDNGRRSDAPITLTQRPLAQMLLLQAALVLPLWWRRRAPEAAFFTVLAAFVAEWAAGIVLRADAALLVAIYSLVLHGQLRRLVWAVPGLAAAVVLVVVRLSGVVGVWDVLFFVITIGTAAVALGFAIRVRRAQLAALRERAVQLEIERDQRSRLATATERARVAREMHDILGHSLSVIITLADGGGHAADAAPERSKEALRLIGDTSRTSLAELRRMLGVLREPTGGPNLSPQPGIADLDLLCRQIRAAGPDVEYQSAGALDTLDAGVQLAAYRIVQEALTNALKHAGPRTRIHLALRVDGPRLLISVRDTGSGGDRPVPAAGEGHGLIGMRERASLYGGTVTAGPASGVGWAVTADLELGREPA
ncbi:signal transduction histidine kinase [Asanoa ferruginea]|uniref:histidine kinase n=1 Tax=Asanoa ferruginea TaxID=53367 RepID=A0A3D9ZTZ6_9ACTN|nr:sensor histidine kinase [Asanoa ferruginea]REG00859.1 signal transduction histidine kinase [Asanoa ferruginea]GIF47266.1 two-component sensor histidine kinase [Asanoa ferruginea]